MKLDKYTQHGLDGPYTTTTLADKVLFWLSGFVAGLITAILMLGK